MVDKKQQRIIPAKLILTLFTAKLFFKTVKIDTQEYVHLIESTKISNREN